VDNNEPSLVAGKQRAESLGIQNMEFILGDISEMIRVNDQYDKNKESSSSLDRIDVVFGLHCCGGLSELAICLAIRHGASFAICTCCFRSHPGLALLTNGQSLCQACNNDTSAADEEDDAIEEEVVVNETTCEDETQTENVDLKILEEGRGEHDSSDVNAVIRQCLVEGCSLEDTLLKVSVFHMLEMYVQKNT
jgi:hypothetical protein